MAVIVEGVLVPFPSHESDLPMPIIPVKVNDVPAQAMFCYAEATGCYMTEKCVQKCKLVNSMDTRCPGYVTTYFSKKKHYILGTVKVPLQFEAQLSNGNKEVATIPTLFYVVRNDLSDIILNLTFGVRNKIIPGEGLVKVGEGTGIIPWLPREEWDEPMRSSDAVITTRCLNLYSSKQEEKCS